MSKKDKWVRRFEVNESAKHKNGFTIYKITSVLFPISSPEVLTIVSVWKRYSEAQKLHAAMKSLHMGLQLKGTCPDLPAHSYFKRFQPEVISERAAAIKCLLEFIADHQLLFTSTDFVNFLQTGYPEPYPESSTKIPSASISAIRASLHLPVVESAPLEYTTDDESPVHRAQDNPKSTDETDYSQIPIYHASDYDFDLQLPSKSNTKQTNQNTSKRNSFDSLNSLESINSDLYSELEKMTVSPAKSSVKKSVLPDLINFDVPSTSKFEDYHTMTHKNTNISSTSQITESSNSTIQGNLNINRNITTDLDITDMATQEIQNKTHETTDNFNTNQTELDYSDMATHQNKMAESLSDSISLSSNTNTLDSTFRCSSRTSQSLLSLSMTECKTRTEDSYVFEAGYVLSLAARYEDSKEYQKAFEYYKAGIEKMLVGLQADPDPSRRALIKAKTHKYLCYAEDIYKNHLTHIDHRLLPLQESCDLNQPPPISMLRRPYDDLANYKVLAILTHKVMLTLHRGDRCCYAMKVIQKIPNNLTEFDDYFLQNKNETRTPILPTLVPYMVPLISYIETENLIFLILAYAPGEKLIDYIKNYVKSSPTTPARDVNLENVFTEPKTMKFEPESDTKNFENKNVSISNEILNIEIDNNNLDTENDQINSLSNENCNIINNSDLSVSELVRNSKTLLQNVEKVLKEVKTPQNELKGEDRSDSNESEKDDNIPIEIVEIQKEIHVVRRNETSLSNNQLSTFPAECIPPSTVCQWGAEILTALECLHNCGVLVRDLHPSNILLGPRGHVCLTYMVGYSAHTALGTQRDDLYTAPELRDVYYCTRFSEEDGFELEKLCDYWSYGAIMYELLTGAPLSAFHTSFTSHTNLRLPDGLPIEARSLLTQLLTHSPTSRLGAGNGGIGEIKSHPYYRHIDWQCIHHAWTIHTD